MTTLARIIRSPGPALVPDLSRFYRRGLTLAGLLALVSLTPGGWTLAAAALSEAYLAVSVFVAGTLTLVTAAERGLKTDIGAWLERHRHWQVPAGALLGAFPGCGGAIVAMTQYSRGYLSFGGVVATLTATMGDAIFLLLAREPLTGLGVLLLGILVGVLSGYAVDAVHGQAFMRPAVRTVAAQSVGTQRPRPWLPARMRLRDLMWIALAAPGLVIGLLAAFQVDPDHWLRAWLGVSPAFLLGVAGAVLAVFMWLNGDTQSDCTHCHTGGVCSTEGGSAMRSVIDDTNFITAWVVFAFVGYEWMVHAFGIDLAAALGVWGPLVPAMAILVGLIPGCGPQIVVTSLYLAGSLPLSAQLGNAIANDGDALFPALAVAPRAAALASLYSAIPALAVAYGWYWLVEQGAA